MTRRTSDFVCPALLLRPIANEREAVVAATGGDELAVLLDRERRDAPGRRHPAEDPVERPVRVVADEREAVVASAGGDELAVLLDRERRAAVYAADPARGDRRCYLAAPAEARVERPVRVVADERKDAVAPPGGDELDRKSVV